MILSLPGPGLSSTSPDRRRRREKRASMIGEYTNNFIVLPFIVWTDNWSKRNGIMKLNSKLNNCLTLTKEKPRYL